MYEIYSLDVVWRNKIRAQHVLRIWNIYGDKLISSWYGNSWRWYRCDNPWRSHRLGSIEHYRRDRRRIRQRGLHNILEHTGRSELFIYDCKRRGRGRVLEVIHKDFIAWRSASTEEVVGTGQMWGEIYRICDTFGKCCRDIYTVSAIMFHCWTNIQYLRTILDKNKSIYGATKKEDFGSWWHRRGPTEFKSAVEIGFGR